MWQQLVRGWLQQSAREVVAQAADELRRAGAGESPEGASASAAAERETFAAVPARCDVAVIFALSSERGALEDRMQGVLSIRGAGCVVRQGGLAGRSVVLCDAGVGREAARRATERVLLGHRPRWVVSAGLAGGLAEHVSLKDLVMVEAVVDPAGRAFELGVRVSNDTLQSWPGVHVGRLVTSDRIVRTPEEKRALYQQTGALAVDMETSAVAEVCAAASLPMLAVRVISDTVNDCLPPEVERFARPQGWAQWAGSAVGAVWNRPGSVKDLWQLREVSLEAADRLARFLEGVIGQLPRAVEAEGGERAAP